jgi:hypothetical protein
MLQGMKEPCGKGESDSILTLSLAGVVVRRMSSCREIPDLNIFGLWLKFGAG